VDRIALKTLSFLCHFLKVEPEQGASNFHSQLTLNQKRSAHMPVQFAVLLELLKKSNLRKTFHLVWKQIEGSYTKSLF